MKTEEKQIGEDSKTFAFDVSVIIINYNTFDFLKVAADGMFSFTDDLKLQLVIVDNASTDGSSEKIKDYFDGKAEIILSDENLGTSKAFNRALKLVKGKYVLWLNPDVVFIEDFIGELYRFAESTPDCGVCGGNLLNAQGKPAESYRKKMLSLKTLKKDYSLTVAVWRKIFKRSLSERFNYTEKPMKVGCVIGADMFVRSEIFEKLGGFNERIFMYAEETEFQFRVQKLTDYKIYSVPTANLIHLEGQSFSGNVYNQRRHELTLRGTAIFIETSYGKDAAEKYLKLAVRSYKKFVAAFLFLGGKRKVYKSKLKTAKSVLEDFKKGNL